MFSVFISLDVLCNVTMYTVTVYQMLYEKVTSWYAAFGPPLQQTISEQWWLCAG